MTSMKVVAFDGTPVAGAAGIRTAIIEHGDGSLSTGEGRRLIRDDVQRLVEGGYVTAIVPALDVTRSGGVVAYRHRDFVFPGVSLDDDVRWSVRGEVAVAYLEENAASTMFELHARVAQLLASVALSKRALEDVHRYARRGLMVAPRLRTSPVAAGLYGVMLAAASMDGDPELIRREIVIMLDGMRAAEATRVAAGALVRSRERIVDARRVDRPLHVGSPGAPREAA